MIYPKSGRLNLKGKKFKRLRCGCCEIHNFKDKILTKIALKELKNELRNLNE